MSPHICLTWLVLRYEPCPWSSRVNICWAGTAFKSSSSQLSRSRRVLTEFRQPLQVQSHLEMPRILVQLGHTQRTWKLAPQTDPKWSPTRRSTRYQDQISVKCTRRTLRMPSFTRATHAQPSLSNFTRRDSDFGEPTRSRGTTRLEQNFPTSPQNKKTKLTHRSLYMSLRTISTPHVN